MPYLAARDAWQLCESIGATPTIETLKQLEEVIIYQQENPYLEPDWIIETPTGTSKR